MKISGAKAVVECLVEQGVDTVFGYPGGAILPVYDALLDSPLRHILTVHEQGAAHAADGYARASGRVGVCLATSGPGATNLVTGIATAYMDSVPLVALTGQVATGLIGRDAFQEVDITGITMPVTKHNFQVKNVQQLPDIIRTAFKIARSGRPGPVLVDIPRDIQAAQLEYTPQKPAVNKEVSVSEENCQLIGQAVTTINQAKSPVVIVGGGAVTAQAHNEVRSFIEKTGIPVVSTLMGLGVVPSDYPQFLGLTGMHGAKTANMAVHEADLLIAIGSRFSDRVTGDRSLYAMSKKVIHIDVDPAEIDKNIDTYIGLTGDFKKIIPMLEQRVGACSIAKWRLRIKEWQHIFKTDYKAGELTPPWLMNFISKQCEGQPYIFVTDVGQNQMWAAQHLTIKSPRDWLTSGGLGTMGFGLPAALGAQLARPDKRVVHICGDGGFKMTGNELYTVAAHKLPIISIIINNSGLGMVRQLQHVFFDKRYSQSELPHPFDFVQYIQAFGIEAASVDSPAQFEQQFVKAQKSDQPYAIVVNISQERWVTPMIAPGAALNTFIDL